ncbi:hypothetical protein CTI12_AA291770 [Artemisia annua]|uniref:Uncharacterized protein n=1 Tax=Artemisia annua TaxID=35608 RepID=A0A2U1N9J9_ARTAN|nr:hypothetical protein CTI12_AA291770 [Artemisia annua]
MFLISNEPDCTCSSSRIVHNAQALTGPTTCPTEGQSCPSLTTNRRATTQASHQMHQSQVSQASSPTNRQSQRIPNNSPTRVSQVFGLNQAGPKVLDFHTGTLQDVDLRVSNTLDGPQLLAYDAVTRNRISGGRSQREVIQDHKQHPLMLASIPAAQGLQVQVIQRHLHLPIHFPRFARDCLHANVFCIGQDHEFRLRVLQVLKSLRERYDGDIAYND